MRPSPLGPLGTVTQPGGAPAMVGAAALVSPSPLPILSMRAPDWAFKT